MAVQPFVNVKAEDFKIIQPYFVGRTRDISKVNTIVLHWTAGSSVDSDIRTLKRKNYGYHFIIDKEGKINQGSPVNKNVGHAGNSYGPNGPYTNGTSIGISFSMRGTKGNRDFNDKQITACKNLILDLKKSVPSLKYLTGHQWVSPGRKIDPYTFPFDSFIKLPDIAGAGLELWKTGYAPFPEKLSDCKCLEKRSNGSCKKSKGDCVGPGKERYSERKLSNEISDLTFTSDQVTN